MKRLLKFAVLLCCLFTVSESYAWRDVVVGKSDTLAGISLKYKPADVSRMDMTIAIRNANPHVFAKASNFKPGVKLVIPTTQVEVRQAIKAKTVAAPLSVASAPKTTSSVAKAPVVAKSVAQKVPAKTAVVTPAKPATVSKKVASSGAATSVLMVKSLQDTVSSQTQTIQDNQNQIDELNGQLNIANQQIQSLQKQGNSSIWTLSNLWLLLWMLTLIALFVQLRKYKQLTRSYDPAVAEDKVKDEPLVEDRAEGFSVVLNERHHEEKVDLQDDEEVSMGERITPQLAKKSSADAEQVFMPAAANWEQVELDIPKAEVEVVAAPPVKKVKKVKVKEEQEEGNPLDIHEETDIPGEQQDIIEALARDEDNMEWHQALLEFYVKTNSQHSFKRHYQSMVKSGVLVEGEPLWEMVRKMYLNKWVYQTT